MATACLSLCGSALGQPPQPVKGSAGEAAAAVGTTTTKPESFLNQAATQNVDINDAMMLDADKQDGWILHGRTYDNQRFSPLTDINLSNVGKLRPTAILQTGVPKNFENTAIAVDGVLYLSTADTKVMGRNSMVMSWRWMRAPASCFGKAIMPRSCPNLPSSIPSPWRPSPLMA